MWFWLGFLVLCLLVVAGGCAARVWSIAAGYKAKVLCSGLFVSRRTADTVIEQDLDGQYALLRTVRAEIDDENCTVTARALGVIRRKALFRPGLGSTLVLGRSEEAVRSQPAPCVQQGRPAAALWPDGEAVDTEAPGSVDTRMVDRALEEAFAEPDPARPLRTRAVVVVHDERIVAERYAPGFSHDTPLPGWSMTKSVTSALIGVCVGQGRLALDQGNLLEEWCRPGDPRAGITVDHLLRMRSGLVFLESYRNPMRGVLPMLFHTGDAAAYAAGSRLEAAPGTRYRYSSGTTNILSRVLRNCLGDSDYLAFPRRALFDPIGMATAVMEPDACGTFVGSSYMYASARDWARFGLLFMRDGAWKGHRILPEGWVEYCRTPSSLDPERPYGAHFWLELPPGKESAAALPPDLFHARGYDGQYMTIVPSRKLVIVRLGLTADMKAWDQAGLVAGVLAACPV